MTKKKSVRVSEQVTDFISATTDQAEAKTQRKQEPKKAATKRSTKPKTAARKPAASKSTSKRSSTTTAKKPVRKGTAAKSTTAKTTSGRKRSAPKPAATTKTAVANKSTARKTTAQKKPVGTKAKAAKTAKVIQKVSNGHHPIDQSVATPVAIAPPEIAPELQTIESAPSAGGVLDSVKQFFAFAGNGFTPVQQPNIADPAAQAEFAPMQRQADTAEPDILQPGPQAEFRDIAPPAIAEAAQAADTPTAEPDAKPEKKPVHVDEDLEYVRVIRAIAMIVIVAEHLAFPLIYRYNEIQFSEWWVGTGIYVLGKAGSPLFTMVSGLLLLNPAKDQSLQVFFKKRFMKVLIPFLGWSAIYLIWQMYWIGVEYTPKEIMIKVIDGPVYYHLWFIQMILGLYLATPIMRIYTRHTTRKNLQYFLAVWFVSTALFPMVRRFYGFSIGIDVYVTVGFMGYFVLGYYLRPIKLNRTQMMYCLAIIGVFTLVTQFLTHWMTLRANGSFDNFFALNTSFNIMILTTAFFLFMKSLDYNKIYARHTWFQFFIKYVGKTSFGLYLVHVLIIEDFRSGRPGIVLHGMTWHPSIAIPVLTIATMALSVIIVLRMQKIPYLKNIVP